MKNQTSIMMTNPTKKPRPTPNPAIRARFTLSTRNERKMTTIPRNPSEPETRKIHPGKAGEPAAD